MKILVIGAEDECEACCKRDTGMWYGESRWGNEPRSYECSNCREVVSEWEYKVPDGMIIPDEPRPLTDEECRVIGWKCEGDDTCSTCGLATYDGKFPLCDECGNCEECAGELKGSEALGGHCCHECIKMENRRHG